MRERPLSEIEADLEYYSDLGKIGRVMNLVNEHGTTFDKMHIAIKEGDFERIEFLESLGINITDDSFLKTAVEHEQLLLISYQINKGASAETINEFAKNANNDLILQYLSKNFLRSNFKN